MRASLEITEAKKITLFDGLSDGEMAEVHPHLRCRIYPADTNIMMFEQHGEAVYIIIEGTAKVHVEQADGSDVILAILGPGDLVGEMSIVDSGLRSASVVTMEESRLCWVDRVTFRHWMDQKPRILHNIIRILSTRLRLANLQIQSLATLDVYGRVARQILAFAREYGQQMPDGGVLVCLRLTQSDLADLIGATRVRVNQVLVDYRQRGYISVDNNHRIAVHNMQALAQRCE